MNFRPQAPISNWEIHKRFTECLDSAYREGILVDQFQFLMTLSELDPEFTVTSLRVFCRECESSLTDLNNEVECVLQFDSGKPDPDIDFSKLEIFAWDLKSFSLSVGAKCVAPVCDLFRSFIRTRNVDMCRRTLLSLRGECVRAKRVIEILYELVCQLLAAGLPIPRVRIPSS